jgi:hypothetical protein
MQKQSEYSGHALGRIPRATILIRNSKTVVENQEPLSMKSLARSQSARRRAAATAALASVGAGILGNHSAEAAIVPIDVSSINGVNGGVTAGTYTTIPDFPTTGAGTLVLANAYVGVITGIGFNTSNGVGGEFATGADPATPVNFAAGTLIDATAGGGAFKIAVYSMFKYGSDVSPDFGPNSFLGFRDVLGRYGYIETTWNSTTNEFHIFSAAYESDVGVGIMTPGAASVPEIDPNGLASALSLVMGSAAMLEQRRRKRAALAAAAVTA